MPYSETFEKYPNWLRWVICFPASIAVYLISAFFIRWSASYLWPTDATGLGMLMNFIIDVTVEPMCIFAMLTVFGSIVSKYKFKAIVIYSSILVVIAILAILTTLLYKDTYDMYNFCRILISDALTIFFIVVSNYESFHREFDVAKKDSMQDCIEV